MKHKCLVPFQTLHYLSGTLSALMSGFSTNVTHMVIGDFSKK